LENDGTTKNQKIMLFLNRKVILTKDNIIKNGKVIPNIVFVTKRKRYNIVLYLTVCDKEETIPALFNMTINLALDNITSLIGNWLQGIVKKIKFKSELVCDLLWAMWNACNDFMFNKARTPSLCNYPFGYTLDRYVVLSLAMEHRQDIDKG
jgi:hypothetical protein